MPRLIDSTTRLIMAGTILLASAGCSSEPAVVPKSDAVPVDVVTIRQTGGHQAEGYQAEGRTSVFDGVLKPRRDIALGFKASGRVLALTVQVGDHVRAGQVLARLSGAEAMADTGQARADLAARALRQLVPAMLPDGQPAWTGSARCRWPRFAIAR